MKNLPIPIAIIVVVLGLLTIAAIRQVLAPLDTVSVGKAKFKVEIADTPAEQSNGLSNRPQLPSGRGMLFVFQQPSPQTFWMKDMRFPIDILWIRDGRVVGMDQDLSPDNGDRLYQSPGSVEFVLELPAGSVKKYQISTSDSFSWHTR